MARTEAKDRWFRHRLRQDETFTVKVRRDRRGRQFIELRIIKDTNDIDGMDPPADNVNNG